MSNSTSQNLLQCPIRQAWISFRLLDEHGNGRPYAGLSYRVTDRHGFDYSGTLDGDGYAHVDNVLQVAAELSPACPWRANGKTYLAQERVAKEDAYLIRAEVSDSVASKGYLPSPDEHWTTLLALEQNAGSAADQPGVALGCNRRHVIEIKALRAYSPLLSRGVDFCALNAYHLAVMSAFAYAPFSTATNPYSPAPPPYLLLGCIGHVLQNQLGRRIQPTQFSTASPFHLLREEVPYSKRLEIMPYDPARYEEEAQKGWQNPRGCALPARHG